MSGGLFGGYQKLLDKVYTGNPEIDAKLDNAAKNYSDTNNYRTHKVLNEISLTQTSGAEADPVSAAANAEPSLQGDVPSPKTNIPQNGNSVNTPDAENSAAKAQQNSENTAQTQQRKPGTVSAEQMYGVKLSQENKNEDFAEWAEKEDAKKKKAAEKEAILAEKQKNADNSNLTNREMRLWSI